MDGEDTHIPISQTDEYTNHEEVPIQKHDKFWLSQPDVLIKQFCVFPSPKNTFNKNMNCITTVIVLIGIILLFFKIQVMYVILAMLISILCIAIFTKMHNKRRKEGFARDPHYLDDDFIQTNVTPLVAEEWHFNPPAYELVSQISGDGRDFTEPVFGKKQYMEPPLVPYRQYLTRTNLLPGDEAEINLFDGGVTGARTYMNDAFTRHALSFKENMSRLYKKSNNRRYRMNNYEVISPYTSF